VVVVKVVVVLIVVKGIVDRELASSDGEVFGEGGFEIGVPTTRVLVKGADEADANAKSVLEACAVGTTMLEPGVCII
jgi:hypothetical protein